MKRKSAFQTYFNSLNCSSLDPIVAKLLNPWRTELSYNIQYIRDIIAYFPNRQRLASTSIHRIMVKDFPSLLLLAVGRTPGRTLFVRYNVQGSLLTPHGRRHLRSSQRFSFRCWKQWNQRQSTEASRFPTFRTLGVCIMNILGPLPKNPETSWLSR